jgi:hypothetical protein
MFLAVIWADVTAKENPEAFALSLLKGRVTTELEPQLPARFRTTPGRVPGGLMQVRPHLQHAGRELDAHALALPEDEEISVSS